MPDEELRLGLLPGAQGMALATGDVYEPYPGAGYIVAPTGSRAWWEQHGDVLPARTWSLSQSRAPELTCGACGRKKLAAFGATCAWCGGVCSAVRG